MPERQRKPLTAEALDKAALDYLAHYASSSANLRRVLQRRVARAGAAVEPGADAARIDAIVARHLASGILDDRAYAAQLAASLHRRGVSDEGTRFRLKDKGVAADDIAAALDALGSRETRTFAAACALARRRRLGPYRPPAARAAARERDLGSLTRAGFSLDVARRVLAARDVDELERLMQESAC